MASLVRFLSIEANRIWGRFAARTRLRALPAMPAAAAVVALGVLAPLMARLDTSPPGLAASLAEERLERFLEANHVWPAGDVVVPRPEIGWEPIPRAATYAVTLHAGEGPAVATSETAGTVFRPSRDLATGTYRVKVVGRDAAGVKVATREGSFAVVEATPRSEISAARPAFHWRPVDGAVQYRVQVRRADAQVVLERVESEPRTMVRPPAVVQPGEYRLVVDALAADGRVVGTRAATFRVRTRLDSDMRDLTSEMGILLDPAEAAFVLAGHYAAKGTAADVLSALESYVEARGGAAAPIATRILARSGVR